MTCHAVFDWYTSVACGDQSQIACVAVGQSDGSFYDLSSLATPENYIVTSEEEVRVVDVPALSFAACAHPAHCP